MTREPKFSVAELFCGCGGLSLGFERTGRFRVVLGADLKKEALRTFKSNFSKRGSNPAVFEADLRELPIGEIEKALVGQGVDDLDFLVAGPPCQGFSQKRRKEIRDGNKIVAFTGYNPLDQDPRNELVLRFLEIAAVLRPKLILIENVPQILRHAYDGRPGGVTKAVKSFLEERMGYECAIAVLNAADFGVPQLRERAFIVAARSGRPRLPSPSHAAPGDENLFSNQLKPWVTVEDAIADLPIPPKGLDQLGGGPQALYNEGAVSAYAALLRSSREFPYNHLSRDYSPKIIKIISEMHPGETWDGASARIMERYEILVAKHRRAGERRQATIKRLSADGLLNPVFFRRYYWSAYTRLSWSSPALTITANANFLGSGRFTHPTANRGITMREAARLQSFPDDFKFVTSADNKESTTRIGIGMDMIGEAVPPLLAEAVAKANLAVLEEMHRGKYAQEDTQAPAEERVSRAGR